MAAGPTGGASGSLTASSASSQKDGWRRQRAKWRRGVCVSGGAGVSERINGSHYMVLTVWPGHGVMDVLWQVMVLRPSKQR